MGGACEPFPADTQGRWNCCVLKVIFANGLPGQIHPATNSVTTAQSLEISEGAGSGNGKSRTVQAEGRIGDGRDDLCDEGSVARLGARGGDTHSDWHQEDDRDGESEEEAPDGQLERVVDEEENRGDQVEDEDSNVVTPRDWGIVALELCMFSLRRISLRCRQDHERKSLTLDVHITGLVEARCDGLADVANVPQENRRQRAGQESERDSVRQRKIRRQLQRPDFGIALFIEREVFVQNLENVHAAERAVVEML